MDLFPPRAIHVRTAPRPLAHWPEAVRSAELLRGSVVRCGPGVRPLGWPDTPVVRLCALAPWSLDQDLIAIGRTAAWVWDAARTPGAPLEFSTSRGRRPRPEAAGPRVVRQFGYADDRVIRLGEHLVTDPLQTLCDLLRLAASLSPGDRVACRLLRVRVGAQVAAAGPAYDPPAEPAPDPVREALAAGPRTGRARALARLEAL